MNHTIKRILLLVPLLMFALGGFAQIFGIGLMTDESRLALYLLAALIIAVLIMLFSNRLFYNREQEIKLRAQQMNTQLALVLDSNKIHVWTYDVVKKAFAILSSQGEKKTEWAAIDFSMLYDHNDFSVMLNHLVGFTDSHQVADSMIVRANRPSETDGIQHIYELNISVLKENRHGRPTVLLGIQRDITDDRIRREKANNLALRYHTVFNSSLVDMIYYDADGVMVDINDKACDTFEVADRDALLASKPRLSDVPSLQGLNIQELDRVHTSSITELSEIDNPIGGLEERYWGTRKTYYEQIMSSVRNEKGELTGVVMAGRNITEMVESQHKQLWGGKQLKKTTKHIQEFIDNINYSLRISGVRLMKYSPDTHELTVSSDLSKPQYTLSQIRCLYLIHESDRDKAANMLLHMDHRHHEMMQETFRTRLHDEQARDVYLTFTMIPTKEQDGCVTHYFGLCRNDSEIVYTETRLREETKKAQETEELKNTFLANMSYEIRTPLNAVLGFAELFNSPHDDADEPVFAEEIKRNTSDLLELVNDILFMSRLDAKMVEFNYTESDFGTLFDGFCYMGWSILQPGVTVSVDNPYSRLMVTIDEQHLGMIISRLCSRAAHYTTSGTIRAKCEYHHGELNIIIEDTGMGIDQKQLEHIFDRFARDEESSRYSSGLDLPIAKELLEQMGGSIEIQSETGKGTTVYVVVPCSMSSLEKKSETN